MRLREVIEKAKNDASVYTLIEKGAFLCSAYVMLNPKEPIRVWNLSYYLPETGKITPVEVSETGVKIGEAGPPLKEKSFEVFSDERFIEAEEALQKALQKAGELQIAPIKTIVSLQKNGLEYWNVTFLTVGGVAFNVRVEAHTGEVLFVEKSSLFNFWHPGTTE